MINEVRNAVLAFLNKNNYGYITPQDFNLYAKQAQLDVFEDMFYQYNYQINKENARQSGTGYADIKKGLEEVIDIFSQDVILINSPANLYATNDASNIFSLPNDYYLINRVYYRPQWVYYAVFNNAPIVPYRLTLLNSGGNPADTSNINLGDFVVNLSTNNFAQVMSIINDTTVGLSADIFPVTPVGVGIYSNKDIVEIEKVHQNRIMRLLSSNLTAPSVDFPAYVINGNTITIYPAEICAPNPLVNSLVPGSLNYIYMMCQYIRYPRDPKWTYLNITGGEPVFDQSQPDYQNFELPDDSFADLIVRILQYAGVGIREIDVANFATTQITTNNQEEA